MNNKLIFLILITFSFVSHKSCASESEHTNEKQVDVSINRYKKDIDLSFKRGTIKIHNHFGDVHLKNTDAHQVGISVIAQELGQHPAIHELLVNNEEEFLSVTVKYKTSDISKHKNQSVNWPIGRVDLVVFIPKDMKLEIETSYGVIDIRRTKNWIKAKSQTGKIDISNHYDIEAISESGTIKVFPMSTKWRKGINLKTKSSSIYAVIPNSESVKLNAATSGVLNSRLDSPESWIKIDSNKFRAVLANYQIKSQMGDIYISPHDQIKEY